jgi:two-component system, NarL family, sensor histidine kinase DesK
MAVALASSLTGRRTWRIASWSWAGARLTERRQPDGPARLAAAGAVTCSIVLPLLELARIATGSVPSPGHAAAALVATACYLPLQVRHVRHATRGTRPAGARWTLLSMAVVIIGALPLIRTSWLTSLHALAVSALIILPLPWSLLAVAGLLAAPAPLAIAFGDPQWAAFSAVSVAWRGASVFVLVWLTGATRRLQEAQLALAEQAEARRTIRGYQQLSLRAELDGAVALLAAAGIQTRLVLPGGDLPESVDAAPRAALRAAVARLLHDGAARDCSIVVTRQDGRVRLELRADGTEPAMTPVVVA